MSLIKDLARAIPVTFFIVCGSIIAGIIMTTLLVFKLATFSPLWLLLPFFWWLGAVILFIVVVIVGIAIADFVRSKKRKVE